MEPTSQTRHPLSPPPAAEAEAPPWNWTPAAQVQLRPVSVLHLQGPDTLRFLHGQTSQALAGSQPGQILSTCCITPTARMRALAEVLIAESGAWLVIQGGDGEAVRASLDRVLFPADAVRLGALQPAWLIQPLPLAPSPASHWRPLEMGEGFWLGDQLLLIGEQDPGSGGQRQDLEPAALELLSRPRLDAEGLERLRLQRGEPASPGEINDDCNPFELGLASRVSLNKGCYVGQETLARLATYDGVRQQLRRWSCVCDADGVIQAAEPLRPGSRLVTGQGERAGLITSALRLGTSRTWIGLAMVRRSALDEAVLHPAEVGSADHDAPKPVGEELVLRMSRPPLFCDPPVGAGSGS